MIGSPGPPEQACYDLDEAMTLLTYGEFDLLAGVVTMRTEVAVLHRKLGLGEDDD